MLQTDNLLPNRWIISMHRRGAEIKRLSLTIWSNCLYPQAVVRLPAPTPTSLLIWLNSVWVASQNIAGASLWHTQHSCHFSLRIALSQQSYNTHQYIHLQIMRHDALEEWLKIQNGLARNTRCIKPSSICKAQFTQSNSNSRTNRYWSNSLQCNFV